MLDDVVALPVLLLLVVVAPDELLLPLVVVLDVPEPPLPAGPPVPALLPQPCATATTTTPDAPRKSQGFMRTSLEDETKATRRRDTGDCHLDGAWITALASFARPSGPSRGPPSPHSGAPPAIHARISSTCAGSSGAPWGPRLGMRLPHGGLSIDTLR